MTVPASCWRLNGVAHDIAHHAQSVLSWLHPHLGQARRVAGAATVTVDLMTDLPPPEITVSGPLAHALQGLRCRFRGMVEGHGHQ